MWKINAATTSSSVTIFPYIKRRLLPLSTTTTKHTRTFAFHKSFSFGCHWKRKPILHFKFIRGNFLLSSKTTTNSFVCLLLNEQFGKHNNSISFGWKFALNECWLFMWPKTLWENTMIPLWEAKEVSLLEVTFTCH